MDSIERIVRARAGGGRPEPGIAVAVLRGGAVEFQGCYGLADLEWGIPIAPDAVFALASVSKPLTALAVVLARQAGLVALDAPIGDCLPGYPEVGKRITIEHLLTHTSGVPNYVVLPEFRAGKVHLAHTPDELIAAFAHLPLDFEPGSRYTYSNSGYWLLGHILESVSGTPFPQLMRDLVFTPLGMRDARYLDDEAIVPRRVRAYDETDDGFVNATAFSSTLTGGAGGFGATLEDMIAFDLAMRAHLVFDADLERELHTPVRLTHGRREGYGLGWSLSTYRGQPTIGHPGGLPGISTFYGRLPEQDLSVVVLSNRGGLDAPKLARAIVDEILDLPDPRPDGHAPAAAPKQWLGTYSDPTLGSARLISENGRFVLDHWGATHRLVRLDDVSYIAADDPGILLTLHPADPHPAITVTHPFIWFTGYRQ